MKTKILTSLFILTITFFVSILQSKAQEPVVFYLVVDTMPEYPGGVATLEKDITSLVEYPEEALKNEIFGKVYVSFFVNEEGKISNARIARGIGPTLDKEALRVINELDKTWEPGIKNGKQVNVEMTIVFEFKKDGTIETSVLKGKSQQE